MIAVHAVATNRRSAKKLAARLHESVRGSMRQTLVAYRVGRDFSVVKATNEMWWSGLDGVTTITPVRHHRYRQPRVWHDVEVV